MTTLTYLLEASVRDGQRTLEGKMLSRPRLAMTDGTNVTYAADVDIGQTGYDPVTAKQVVQPLRNVPIAQGVRELVYAEAGMAVTLTRSKSGRWEITGFAKRMPGKYVRVGVRPPAFCFGLPDYELDPDDDVGLEARPLTYGELATYGGYGTVPYGATGIFRGGVLIEITV